MIKYIQLTTICVILILGLLSCDKMLLEDAPENNPESNFEYFWKDFDQRYGLFGVKNVDWDSLYAVYRPAINQNSSDKELYDALCQMITPLDDGHIYLSPTNLELPIYYGSEVDRKGDLKDFDIKVVKENYLLETKSVDNIFHYGKLDNNIGYIHIKSMDSSYEFNKKAIDEALNYLKNTKAVILDVRHNGGGWDRAIAAIGGRFFTQKTHFLTVRKKNGPKRNDFCDPVNYYIEPYGDFQYTEPLILLTNRGSASAAETFTLGMKRIEGLVHIGDTTNGIFSDAIPREMPNGWIYSLSVGDYRDYNNISWEGMGVPPEIVVQNDSNDVKNGTDEALDYAMDYLNK